MKINVGEIVMFAAGPNGAVQEPSEDFEDFATQATLAKVIEATDDCITVEIVDEESRSQARKTIQAKDYGMLRFPCGPAQPTA